MQSFPRPVDAYPAVTRTVTDHSCPHCGLASVAAYRVLSAGGWWDVVKCTSCLHSIERNRAPRFGAFQPLIRAQRSPAADEIKESPDVRR
jgi:predicted RNA-binding Zn-ribbon protein involved in translation (DUF1610 family)